jgi:two-component system, NtrC family, response regulator AtoC
MTTTAPTPPDPPTPRGLGRILVIDDDPDIVELLTGYFVESGYDVVAALHGGDGLMLADIDRPDVVLLDIKMPGMSGTEVLQQLKVRRPELPVIIVSGYADAELARRSLRRGAFDYIRKPFDLEHLHRCVAAAFGAARASAHRSTARA